MNIDFELLCEQAIGKKVRIVFKDGGEAIRGKCIGYTKAVDNEPEIACIDVISDRDGCCYGLDEPEVADIEILN